MRLSARGLQSGLPFLRDVYFLTAGYSMMGDWQLNSCFVTIRQVIPHPISSILIEVWVQQQMLVISPSFAIFGYPILKILKPLKVIFTLNYYHLYVNILLCLLPRTLLKDLNWVHRNNISNNCNKKVINKIIPVSVEQA